ncbi:MAG: four helix bundle protein [Deltaproteobacteria bacterium]|nr:four helix bundle protein [Deltaproteobacteria bacterium]
MKFGYEDLKVWSKAVDFSITVINIVESIVTDRKHYRLFEQIESCSTSIALNIAEGKGRFSHKEFIHFLYIARGSLYETLTLLEIFRRLKWISDSTYDVIKNDGIEIVSMIKGLINSISVIES